MTEQRITDWVLPIPIVLVDEHRLVITARLQAGGRMLPMSQLHIPGGIGGDQVYVHRLRIVSEVSSDGGTLLDDQAMKSIAWETIEQIASFVQRYSADTVIAGVLGVVADAIREGRIEEENREPRRERRESRTAKVIAVDRTGHPTRELRLHLFMDDVDDDIRPGDQLRLVEVQDVIE